MALFIENVDAYAAKLATLLAAAACIDDRSAVIALLPYPKTAYELLQRWRVTALHVGLEMLGALMQQRRNGIVESGRDRAEKERGDNGRRHIARRTPRQRAQ